MNYLVFDLEMTGTEPGWHEIVQIGAAIYDENWEKKSSFLTNVYPENEESFSLPALEVHGLTLDILEEAPMLHEAIEAFENWAVTTVLGHKKWQEHQKPGALKRLVVCGQSVHYDINFLRFAYMDLKQPYPFSFKTIDLYQQAYFLFRLLRENGQPTSKGLSLGALSEYFGLQREGDMHNALEDAELTAACLKEVFNYLPKFKYDPA